MPQICNKDKGMGFTSLNAPPSCCSAQSPFQLPLHAAVRISFQLDKGYHAFLQSEDLLQFLYPQSTGELSCKGIIYDCDPSHPKPMIIQSLIRHAINLCKKQLYYQSPFSFNWRFQDDESNLVGHAFSYEYSLFGHAYSSHPCLQELFIRQR